MAASFNSITVSFQVLNLGTCLLCLLLPEGIALKSYILDAPKLPLPVAWREDGRAGTSLILWAWKWFEACLLSVLQSTLGPGYGLPNVILLVKCLRKDRTLDPRLRDS